MTINKKIENALSKLVNGNIWPNVVPKENSTKEWITYVVPKMPIEYGDDVDQTWLIQVNIHYVHKGIVNHLKMEKELRNRLREAGFSVTYCEPLYDDGTTATHIIINANILEDGD